MRVGVISVLVTTMLAFAGPVLAQDEHEAQEGQKIFKRVCFTCHTSEKGKNKVGPSLFGVVGRKSGTAPGFAYSEAMKTANVIWNKETIDKYLTDPKTFVPKNKMAYAGVKKADERKEIIAYLETLH